jgi:beta-phosphoglucomutase-like phosphatase (HAD superfamily)
MVTIDVERLGAFIFDLDGVVTETASLHVRTWQRPFDEFLGQHSKANRGPIRPRNGILSVSDSQPPRFRAEAGRWHDAGP